MCGRKKYAKLILMMMSRLRNEKRDHWWQDELGKATAILKVLFCISTEILFRSRLNEICSV